MRLVGPRGIAVIAASFLGLVLNTSFGYKAVHAQTLKIPFSEDMGTPDPAIFYAPEGLLVTTNVYEGLLRYKAGTTDMEPSLAERWSVSQDGATYTFYLRKSVKFHDGSDLTAQAVIGSFQRRIDVKGAPSYMLADVAEMKALDTHTVVIKLKKPVSPFLHYLAAPYGPKILSPKFLAEKAGKDFGKKWLQTHDAGTGPYKITEWNVGREYVLEAFGNYWGKKAHFKIVRIPIIPSASTKAIQLKRGDLDIVLSGLPVSTIRQFRKNPKFAVYDFPTVGKLYLVVNTQAGVFKNAALRKALAHVINREMIVRVVFGESASVSTDFYPWHSFSGRVPDDPKYEPNRLKAQVAKVDQKDVEIAVPQAFGPDARRVAELVQVQLSRAGLKATVRDISMARLFDMPTNKSIRPDIVLLAVPPDAPNPDAHIRINFYTKGPVNLLGCSVPEADKQIDHGAGATAAVTIGEAYAEAAKLILQEGCVVNIADLKDSIVARKRIGGITHIPAIPGSVRLEQLFERK